METNKTMIALKTSVFVCLVLIALVDATQIFGASAHGRIIRKLKDAAEEKNVQRSRYSNHIFSVPHLSASVKAAYNFAVDITQYGSTSTFRCLYNLGYNAVFVQAYSAVNGGSLNTDLIQNLNNAGLAGLGNEVYVTPATSGKTGQTQFDEVYNHIINSGVTLRSIWLQVSSPLGWSRSVHNNINFVESFVNRGNSHGISVGIFTNRNDWHNITGSYTGFSTLRLWYWNNHGSGVKGESSANFDDFISIGSWTKAVVKQFGINEVICGLTLNRDVYPVLPSVSKNTGKNADRKLYVGGFI